MCRVDVRVEKALAPYFGIPFVWAVHTDTFKKEESCEAKYYTVCFGAIFIATSVIFFMQTTLVILSPRQLCKSFVH